MLWLLKKGDTMEAGTMVYTPLKCNVPNGLLSTGLRQCSERIYYCADDDPPSGLEKSILSGISTLLEI
jgi:hypothetical protein